MSMHFPASEHPPCRFLFQPESSSHTQGARERESSGLSSRGKSGSEMGRPGALLAEEVKSDLPLGNP